MHIQSFGNGLLSQTLSVSQIIYKSNSHSISKTVDLLTKCISHTEQDLDSEGIILHPPNPSLKQTQVGLIVLLHKRNHTQIKHKVFHKLVAKTSRVLMYVRSTFLLLKTKQSNK